MFNDEEINIKLDNIFGYEDKLKDGVFKCRRHGERKEEQCYRSKDKHSNYGFRYKCKECVYLNTFKRPCKIHGDVSKEQRLATGRCRLCSVQAMHMLNERRNNNRPEFNERQKLKREANPEKYALENKERYQKELEKYGADYLNDLNKASIRGLSIEQYHQMFIDQKDLCAICNQPESRIYKYKDESKGIKIAKLCLDHSHKTGKVRELLCHDCNSGLGKFADDIQRLYAAIDYLKRHE